MKKILFLLALAFNTMQWSNGFATCFPEVVPHCTPYYVSIFGGANFVDESKHRSLHVDIETGYIGSLAIGYDFDPLRVEGEVSYRWNKISRVKKESGAHRHADAHIDSLFWMVNGYYDCYYYRYFTPYIALGVGYGSMKAHSASDHETSHRLRSSGAALQAILGVKTRIWDNIDLGAEYRYLAARKDIVEQSIGIKLSYAF